MKTLLAEDDADTRAAVELLLQQWGYDVVSTENGAEAWAAMQAAGEPVLALLDVMMPELDGLEVCRLARAHLTAAPPYIIMVTAKNSSEDVINGLQAGANDYVRKPFVPEELRARLQVGARMLELQQSLIERVAELEAALAHVNQLQGMLPICSYCKKIRDDRNYWQQLESYITARSDAQFSHSICPDCYTSIVKPEIDKLKREG